MTSPGRSGSPDPPRKPVGALGRRLARIGWWRLGLVGVACIVLGSGWYQVWFGPPYRYVDEQAHAGYVLEVQAGRAPTIDTPIDSDAGGPELRERLAAELPRRRDVWVANNPPLPYVAAAGPAAVSRAVGLSGGPLVGLRLANLTAMAAAVVLACRIGLAVSGGDARAGLLTGAVAGAVPHTGFLAGMGMTDGFALLATVGAIGAVAHREGRWTRRWWSHVLLWAALGAAVRPMTAVLCAAVVAFAVGWRAMVSVRERTATPGTGSSAASPASRPATSGGPHRLSLVAAGVAAAISAAWYVRNIALYGDPTGSDHLFEKFERSPRPLTDLSPWTATRSIVDTLFIRRLQNELDTDPLIWSPLVFGLLALGVVGVLGAALAERRRVGPPADRVRRLIDLPVVALLGGLVVVNLALVASHWTGGGGLHPRYALLLVPVGASLVATAVSRWGGRPGSLLLLVGPLALLWYQVPKSSTWVNDHKTAPLDSPLTTSIGPEWVRLGGLVLVAAGALLVAAALMAVRADAAWRTRGAERYSG